MSQLSLCLNCHHHYRGTMCRTCLSVKGRSMSGVLGVGVSVLLGLGLTSCGEAEKDSAEETITEEPAEEPAPEPADAPMYGAPGMD